MQTYNGKHIGSLQLCGFVCTFAESGAPIYRVALLVCKQHTVCMLHVRQIYVYFVLYLTEMYITHQKACVKSTNIVDHINCTWTPDTLQAYTPRRYFICSIFFTGVLLVFYIIILGEERVRVLLQLPRKGTFFFKIYGSQ